MQEKYDVIVVGAGNGGLMAAATTAKAGLKTLLLEKHNLPGGCASSFVRGRFEFEPSLHELCGVGTAEKPGSIYKFFDDLGAGIDWRYDPQEIYRVIAKGPEGYDVVVRSGIDAYCESIDAVVPGCKKAVKKFLEYTYSNAKAIEYITKTKGKPNKLVMLFKHGDFMRCASHSVEEVQAALGIPKKARDIMNTYWGYLGVPTDELNCFHYLNMIERYIVMGAAMPHYRSHELSLAIVDVIRSCGGEVRYNSEVTGFIFDDKGTVVGVKVGEQELYAKEIISNVIPNNVYNMTNDPTKIPEKDLKLANARKLGTSIVTAYLGMDCSMEELGVKDYTTFIMADPDPRKQFKMGRKGFYIVNCLNKVIPDATPEGTCSIFFSILMRPEDFPKDLKPEEYKKYKNALILEYIEDYKDTVGVDLLPHIEEIEVATPVTFARYLGTPGGTIYGYDNSGWDNVLVRTSCQATDLSIPGLSFVGGHGTQGDGYSSAYKSGEAVATKIVAKLKGGN